MPGKSGVGPGLRLNTRKPYRPLDSLDYMEQGGEVYAWSESNHCYEWAWFLYTDLNALDQFQRKRAEDRIATILRDRPVTAEVVKCMMDKTMCELLEKHCGG